MSSTETAEKLLTKLSGFLISCAIPAVSWPSEASFSVWTKAVLRGPQILQRFRQFARTGLHAFEQARILDRHHRLVCKGLQQVDGGFCGNSPGVLRRTTSAPTMWSGRSSGMTRMPR